MADFASQNAEKVLFFRIVRIIIVSSWIVQKLNWRMMNFVQHAQKRTYVHFRIVIIEYITNLRCVRNICVNSINVL
jgi:hypothetical protein